jgi:membrane-associated PAP2 superfamily phosphatase
MHGRLRAGVGRELWIALSVLAAATAVFWTTRLDLSAADLFRTPCCSWPLAEREPWRFLYRYGVLSGIGLAAAALIVLTASYWDPRRLYRLRRPSLFLVLVAAIGPGLLVNVGFKDHYGRPRPREVQELGGQERFLPVWVKGDDDQAKSFPCGHCSMGFYVSTPYLVLRRRRRGLALAFLGSGLCLGLILGAARMMAGGHFLSDVVWSGGLVWLTALVLHRWLAPDLALDEAPPPAALVRDRRKARLATALAGGSLAVLTVAALLATPYFSSKVLAYDAAQAAADPAARWEIALDRGTVRIEAGPGLEVAWQVRAFGFPTSRIGFVTRHQGDAALISVDQVGWFTERRIDLRLRLPASGPKPVRVRLGKGKLTLDLRGFTPSARLEVEVEDGDVQVLGAEALETGSIQLRVPHGRIDRH